MTLLFFSSGTVVKTVLSVQGGMGLTLSRKTKTPHAMQCCQEKKKKKIHSLTHLQNSLCHVR